MGNFKEFAVNMIVTTEHEYLVPARTEEEAADIAQELFDSGDEGEVLSTSIESIEAMSGAQSDDEELMEAVYLAEE